MANFTADLQTPDRVSVPNGGGGISGEAIVGGVIGGVGDIAGAYFKKAGETARAESSNDLAKQISDLVQQGAQSGPPKLVGQDPDPTQSAGANSATGQQLSSDLGRVHQASQQGSMSEQEKLVRVNTMVQDAVNKDPLHADYYRELAKNTLGVTPTAELFKLQNESADFDKTLSQQVYQTNVAASAQAGITILKPDGTPDLQSMAASGAKVLQTDKDAELKLKAAQLASGNKLSHEDQVSLEVNTAMGGLNPTLNQLHDSLLNNLPALVTKYGANGRDQAVAQLSVDLNNTQAQTMNYVDGFIIKNRVSPEAAGKIREEVRSMFDDYRTLFGDPKAPLDQISANAKTLKDASTLGQLDFRKLMPVAARLKDAVGDQGLAALFAQESVLSPTVAGQLQNETKGFLGDHPSATDTARAATAAFTGAYDVSKEQRPQWQSAVTSGIVKTVNALVRTPDKLSPEQQTAFGHSMVQISNVALNDKSPANLEAAASTINSPSVVRTFLNFAKNDNNAKHLPIVALGMNSLLYQHIAAARRTLAQGADMSIQLPMQPSTASRDPMVVARAGYGPGVTISVHAGAVYNPQSGQVEFQMSASGADGKSVSLSPQQAQDAMKSFSTYRNSVLQVNRSLDAMSQISPYAHDGTDQFKPLELKGVTAQSAGIPIKAGMTVPTPKSQQQEQGSGFTSKTNKLEGGAPGSKNPRSSASGYGQFIDKTWLGLAKEQFPEEVKGMKDNEILNLRDNQPFANRMIEAYKMQNASRLKAAGIENPDDADLYMAHHFGAEGALKIMNAPLNAPLENVLSPEVMKANPDLKGMTPKKIYMKYSSAFSGGNG